MDRSWPYSGPRLFFEFFGGFSDFLLKENISFPVNAKITPIAYVLRLFLHLNSRQAFHHVGFFKGKLRSQTFFEVPPDCSCTSVNTTWRTASLMQNLRQLFFT